MGEVRLLVTRLVGGELSEPYVAGIRCEFDLTNCQEVGDWTTHPDSWPEHTGEFRPLIRSTKTLNELEEPEQWGVVFQSTAGPWDDSTEVNFWAAKLGDSGWELGPGLVTTSEMCPAGNGFWGDYDDLVVHNERYAGQPAPGFFSPYSDSGPSPEFRPDQSCEFSIRFKSHHVHLSFMQFNTDPIAWGGH